MHFSTPSKGRLVFVTSLYTVTTYAVGFMTYALNQFQNGEKIRSDGNVIRDSIKNNFV